MIRLVEGSEDSSITDFEVKCRDGAQPRAVREREREEAGGGNIRDVGPGADSRAQPRKW